jgi:hypothetical protein
MKASQYLNLDLVPIYVVLGIGAGVVLMLRCLEMWATRRARQRTHDAVRSVEAERKSRT